MKKRLYAGTIENQRPERESDLFTDVFYGTITLLTSGVWLFLLWL